MVNKVKIKNGINTKNPRYRKALEERRKKALSKAIGITGLLAVCILTIVFGANYTINAKGDKKMNFDQFEMPQAGEEIAIIRTTKGDIKMRLFPQFAPKAVENFVTHSKDGYYDNVIFHRVIDEFMIQTGDPTGTGYGGESIWNTYFEDELTPNLSLFYGAVAMANGGANTNGSQFFIVEAENANENVLNQLEMMKISKSIIDSYKKHGGTPHLDYRFTASRHTVFGQVIEGLEVVKNIAQVETDGNDKPLEEIKIITIDIEEFK